MMQRKIITPALSAYFIASLIWGIPSGICFLGILRNWGSPGSLETLAIIVVFGMVVFSWLFSIKIDINQEGIEYRELFKGCVFFRFEEISSVEGLYTGNPPGRGQKNKPLPPMRLIINGDKNKKMVINTKVLKREDIATLRGFLMKIDKTAPENRKNYFSYLFEEK